MNHTMVTGLRYIHDAGQINASGKLLNELTLFQRWGLAEEEDGVWRVNDLARDFLQGKARVPKHVMFGEGTHWTSEETVALEEL